VTELHYGRSEIRNLEGMREFIIFKNSQAGFGTESGSFFTGTQPFSGDEAAGCEGHNSHPYNA